MRESLRKSIADNGEGFERYPKGSIVVCNSCAKPVFKLDRGVDLGAGAGKAASAFKPLTRADLDALVEREDIDAGVLAFLKTLDYEACAFYLSKLKEMRPGDPMLCPVCEGCFVQVISVDRHEMLDKAYTIEMLTIPPPGHKQMPLRGRQLGTNKGWLHEGKVH